MPAFSLFRSSVLFLFSLSLAACGSGGGNSGAGGGDPLPHLTWTWLGGSDTVNQTGVYGVMGTADAANVPGAHSAPAGVTDSGGRLWVFGGWGVDASSNVGYLNDLWRYQP